MISSKNKPLNLKSQISDFTTDQYRQLLILAKKNYNFITYNNINMSKKFILWRHDLDFSINRAAKLAEIESSEQITATYFINPHCEFYNILEKEQSDLIKKILKYGHHLAIHFDSEFYNIKNEDELDEKIEIESNLIEHIFEFRPTVFSFHNPNNFLLTCEKDEYGGLINCYSTKFKNEIPYISDSNGYWRFQRLKDVLLNADEKNLHVLTHPAWWQDQEEEPYYRIKRCVDGRANNTLANHEKKLDKDGRLNIGKKTSTHE